MSENRMLLDEIRELKRRLQALETRQEHPGFAASDVARLSVANTFAGVQTIPNTGLHLLDTTASHDLILAPGSNLTADRTLTLTTGDANRTLTLTGDATLNQDVSTAGSPTFTGRTTISGLKNTSFLRLSSTTNDASWSVGDQIGALEFYSADGSNGGAGVVGKISVINDIAASGNRVGMLFQTRGTASGVTVDAIYIDEIGRVGLRTKDPTYSLFEMAAPALGTNAFLSFSVPDGTYNPRALINHVTSTTRQYVQFDSGFTTGSGLADWVFSGGSVIIDTTANNGGKLQVNQGSTGAAIPALRLNQADISEGFVDYVGTSAASAAGPISSWTAATIAGFVRCEINGAAYWMPYYNAPTA